MTSLYKYIKNNKISLSKNEKLIRKYLLDNYDIKFSTKTISEKLYIAPSGVSRYLKKIKYKNIKQLNKDKALQLQGYDEIFKHMYKEKQELLEQTYKLNDYKNIVEFSKILNSVKTIYIHGVGYSELEARNLQMRLARIGYRIILLQNRHDIVTYSSSKQMEDSVCLLISQTGETDELLYFYNFLLKLKVKVLTITNEPKSTIAKLSEKIILVPKIYSGYKMEGIFSEITTGLLLDYIYMVFIIENYDKAQDMYTKTRELIKKNN